LCVLNRFVESVPKDKRLFRSSWMRLTVENAS
jgi:hypothetical protein